MFGSENVKIVPLVIATDPGGDDEMFYVAKAPRRGTVVAAYVTSELAGGAGTAIGIQLENWGPAGTAVEGTIAAQVGGTATANLFSARTPRAMTIDSDHDDLDQGDWIVAHYIEEGAGWQSGDRLHLEVHYVDGIGA
jgi:hypothetical protein